MAYLGVLAGHDAGREVARALCPEVAISDLGTRIVSYAGAQVATWRPTRKVSPQRILTTPILSPRRLVLRCINADFLNHVLFRSVFRDLQDVYPFAPLEIQKMY